MLRNAPRWGISVLTDKQEALLTALRRPAGERFQGIDVSIHDGAVHIRDALATIAVGPHTVLKRETTNS